MARKKGGSVKDTLHYIGIKRSQGFYSLEELITCIKNTKYKSARELRTQDHSLYKKIAQFVGSHKDELSMKDVWIQAGLSCSNTGRPSNKILKDPA